MLYVLCITRIFHYFSDSAHRVHPLAGQGVNLGFGDVTCLSDLLAEAVYSGRNLGRYFHCMMSQ